MKSRARRDGEDWEKFIRRCRRSMGTAIDACVGNISKIAVVYDQDEQFIQDVISTTPKLEARIKRIRSNAFRAGDEVSLMDEPDEVPSGVDSRLRRRNWSRDPSERLSDLVECLKISLVENEGDIVECSECLNVPVDEIFDLVDRVEELEYCQSRGLRVKALRAQSQLFKNSDGGNHQANKMVLTNLLGESWSDRSHVDISHSGFQPPDGAEVPDILSIVQGEK